MRQHKTAQGEEQIDGEIARSVVSPEKLFGMAMYDEERSYAPYAIEQYEAFRGRLDHGR
jgi:hypothetical protein